MGPGALLNNNSGEENTAVGMNALARSCASPVPERCLESTSGNDNTALGFNAGIYVNERQQQHRDWQQRGIDRLEYHNR